MNDSVSRPNNTRKADKNTPRASELLDTIKQRIETQEGSYRFLYTSPKSIYAKYLFVGLNPGGKETDPSDISVDVGNAILNENWNKTGTGKNPLQEQIIYFFDKLANSVGIEEWMPFMSDKWMISNCVFYRSPRWQEMAPKKDHIKNCKTIWKDIIKHNKIKVIIANGHDTYTFMIKLMEDDGWSINEEKKSCRAWDGPHTAILKNGENICLIVGFAHLSTFKVVKRAENKVCMDNLYKLIGEHL